MQISQIGSFLKIIIISGALPVLLRNLVFLNGDLNHVKKKFNWKVVSINLHFLKVL